MLLNPVGVAVFMEVSIHAVFDKSFSCVIDERIAKRSGKFKSHDGFLGQSKPGPKTAAG